MAPYTIQQRVKIIKSFHHSLEFYCLLNRRSEIIIGRIIEKCWYRFEGGS